MYAATAFRHVPIDVRSAATVMNVARVTWWNAGRFHNGEGLWPGPSYDHVVEVVGASVSLEGRVAAFARLPGGPCLDLDFVDVESDNFPLVMP